MGLVFSISNFFINKTYPANKSSAKKIPSCANLALPYSTGHSYFRKCKEKPGISFTKKPVVKGYFLLIWPILETRAEMLQKFRLLLEMEVHEKLPLTFTDL